MSTPPEKDTELRLWASFRDLANQLADPATITLFVKTPAGVQTTYTYAAAQVQKDAVGVYYYDLLFDQVGRWTYRWLSTGDPAVSDSSLINVTAPTTT